MSHIMEAFILGIASGTICVAYCAPVLVAYLMGESKALGGNFGVLSFFLSGRLLGYLLFAVIAWGISNSLIWAGPSRELIIGCAYVILSILLIPYAFLEIHPSCATRLTGPLLMWIRNRHPILFPAVIGFATGLNFCPPFLLAVTGAAEGGTFLKSILFFFAFFLGTSIFFIPIPFLSILRRFSVLATIGKLATGLIGLYYLYAGSMTLIGGLKKI